MREQYRLEIISGILEKYLDAAKKHQGYLQLHIFLQDYFRQNKQMGSRDRKIASSALYNYFRLGKSCNFADTPERLAISSFLCEGQTSPFLSQLLFLLKGINEEDLQKVLQDKLKLLKKLYPDFKPDEIYPLHNYLSEEIEKKSFIQSILVKPGVFIRIRPGFEKKVLEDFLKYNIHYTGLPDLPGAFQLEHTVGLNELPSKKEGFFEIQDYSSQKTGTLFNAQAGEKWWDCCAGSGGKSLLLLSHQAKVNLTASDIRPQIIENLKTRLKAAGASNVRTMLLDLTKEKAQQKAWYDGIIADVPCSGSGTWGRTPEMLSLFKESEIEGYVQKQRKIVEAALPALKPDGSLIYITCSVFSRENENQLNYFETAYGLKVESAVYFKGYSHRADTLFAARLKR
jgi:16S rRNA (cytosine967-C5)-methyltransferase